MSKASLCKQLHRSTPWVLKQSQELDKLVSTYSLRISTMLILSLMKLPMFSCSRIDGNSLSGKIPEFIGNWTQLVRLWVKAFSLRLLNSQEHFVVTKLLWKLQWSSRHINVRSNSSFALKLDEHDWTVSKKSLTMTFLAYKSLQILLSLKKALFLLSGE